ncbi:hypothetical protein KUTeg_014693 [Tegillarca granosa]|uniref:Myb/SANT-like DNA-binding domain-containing protein n=1 Tax=Tegillarca granosa TaxID=220873 RepID=A0ABQ9EWW4_TEGGR|nr:hypothetical protein KUTeg_014693 [Tegillarca granosa]
MSRKRNFEEQEIGILLSTYKKNFEILNAKFGNAITNKKKKQKWEELANAVNSVRKQNRTVDEIKHKWKDLLSRAKKDFSNRRHPKTGGGPKPTEGPYTDIVLDIIGEASPVLIGISSGGESALQDAKSDDDSNLTNDTNVDNVNQTGSYAVEVSTEPNSTEFTIKD